LAGLEISLTIRYGRLIVGHPDWPAQPDVQNRSAGSD